MAFVNCMPLWQFFGIIYFHIWVFDTFLKQLFNNIKSFDLKKDKWPKKLIIFSEKLHDLDQITLKIWHFWEKMLSTSLKISIDNSERKHKKSKQQNVSCWSFSGSIKKQGHSNIISSLLHFVEISQLSTYQKLQFILKIVVLT